MFVCLAVLEVNWQVGQGYNPTFTPRQLEFTSGNSVTLGAGQAAVKDE